MVREVSTIDALCGWRDEYVQWLESFLLPKPPVAGMMTNNKLFQQKREVSAPDALCGWRDECLVVRGVSTTRALYGQDDGL